MKKAEEYETKEGTTDLESVYYMKGERVKSNSPIRAIPPVIGTALFSG